MDVQGARRLVVGLFLLALAFDIIREAQNKSNPTRPLPRPVTLVRIAAVYTVFGVAGQFLPQVAALTATGFTLSLFIAPAAAGQQNPIQVLDNAITTLDGITGGAS